MHRNRKIGKLFCLITLVLMTLILLPVTPVFAQSGLVLSTSFPGISVQPGETVNLPIKLENIGISGRVVDISVANAPKGWEPTLKGQNYLIHEIFVGQNLSEDFTFTVQVPEDVKEGSYNFTLKASGGGVQSVLPLQLNVSNANVSAAQLTVQYPSLSGPANASFRFSAQLVNNSVKDQMFALAAQAQPGFDVSIKPSYAADRAITSLNVKSGSTEVLYVDVALPPDLPEGKYPIMFQAIGGSKPLTVNLETVVTGSYKISLETPNQQLNANAYAGKETPITLNIKNTGTTELRQVQLTSNAPDNWAVAFKPEKLDTIPVGGTAQVTAYVRPSRQAIAGDYMVSLKSSVLGAIDGKDIRVSVKTPTIWGWFGIGIILLVIAGVLRAFKVYGRR
ncbi:MAG: NEW3 domain-containing protein [Bacillota bacterium]